MLPTELIGQEIRGTHPYAYRSGEWAKIVDIELTQVRGKTRWVWVMRWPDGAEDRSPIHNSGYDNEFRVTKTAQELGFDTDPNNG